MRTLALLACSALCACTAAGVTADDVADSGSRPADLSAATDASSRDLAPAADLAAATDLAMQERDGATGCQGEMDVAVDNGGLERLDSICSGSWGAGETMRALGYLFSGGPFPGIQRMVLSGCASAAQGAEGLTLSLDKAMGPGTFTKGLASYTDKNGVAWGVTGDPLSVTITRFDPVGGVIEGSFTATATHGGNAAHALAGRFHLCRVHDELAP